MKKIILFYGGPGLEKKVSQKSANFVSSYLCKKYIVNKIKVDENLNWFFENKIILKKDVFLKRFDIAINFIHGEYGEDGNIQKIFEKNKIPFLGSCSKSSKITMSKVFTKEIFIKNNISTSNFLKLKRDNLNDNFLKIKKKFGNIKMIMKPENGGSSFGIFIIKTDYEIKNALKKVFDIENNIIVEEFIEGREFSCGIVDFKNKIFTLPIVEIKSKDRCFFDFEAKYNGLSEEICPAKITNNLKNEIDKICLKIFELFKLKDFSRVDLLVRNNKIYIIEINTIPGFTKESIFPKELLVQKINIVKFFENLIEKHLD